MMTTTEQPSDTRAPEFVGFADVRVGDTLTFCNRDNGFGGSGARVERTGVVTGTTDRTITVQIVGHNPLAEHVYSLDSRGRGRGRTLGLTARLRAADWYDRSVRRVEKADRVPYDADHVSYVTEAGEVTALYIPDPAHAQDPRGTWAKCRESLAWWREAGVEVIGSIVRDGRRWYWEGPAELDPFPDGEPTTKRDALPGLRRAVDAHFTTSLN